MSDYNQAAEHASTEEAGNVTASCPLQNEHIDIIPVRYALDSFVEREKGSAPTAAMPLSDCKDWEPRFSGLKTRDYTLRQLRDGWVYVYNHSEPDKDKKLVEYQFSDGLFYLVERQQGQDVCDPTYVLSGQPRLQFKREDHLEISYSEVQWSWDHCQLVCSEPLFRDNCMQTLDLKQYCRSSSVKHATMGEHFAHALSDITPVHGQDFKPNKSNLLADTLTPTSNGDEDRLPAPPRDESHYIQSQDQYDNTVVFALHDPLADLWDLQFSYIAAHLRLTCDLEGKALAEAIWTLCTVDYDESELPEKVQNNPELKEAFLKDIDSYLQMEAEHTRAQIIASTGQGGAGYALHATLPRSDEQKALQQQLQEQYGYHYNEIVTVDEKELNLRLRDYRRWRAKNDWRKEVHFEQLEQEVEQIREQLPEHKRHLDDARHDLQAALTTFKHTPATAGYDVALPSHMESMLDFVAELDQILVQDESEENRQWLENELRDTKTLVGASLYGFSPELKNAIVDNVGDLNNIAGRMGDGLGFIDNDSITGQVWFKTLSQPVQQVYRTLTEVTSGAACHAWVSLLEAAFPTMSKAVAANPQKSLRYLLVTSLFGDEPAGLQGNLNYESENDYWKKESAKLEKDKRKFKSSLEEAKAKQETNLRKDQRADVKKKIKNLNRDIENIELRKAHLDRTYKPKAIIFQSAKRNQQLQNDIARFTNDIADGYADFRKQASAVSGRYGGAMNILVALMNVANTAVFVHSKESSFDKKEDLQALVFNLSYTANAMAAMYQAVAENGLKEAARDSLKTAKDSKHIPSVLDETAKYWSKKKPTYANSIKSFGARTALMGGLGLIAVTFELWQITDDLDNVSTNQERYLKQTQRAGLSLQGAGFSVQLGAGLLAKLGIRSVALLLNPLLSGAIFVGGLVYMVASLAINYFKKDAMQLWLRRTPWGKGAIWGKNSEDLREAWVSLQELMLKPTVFVQETRSVSGYQYSHIANRNVPVFKTSGYWLKIGFPPLLAGHIVRTKLANIDSQGWFADDHRQYDFTDDWFAGHWSDQEIGERVVSSPSAEDVSKVNYTADDQRVWQIHLPADASVDRIEIEIYYPYQVLSAQKEREKGFRFDVDLSMKGTLAEPLDNQAKKKLLLDRLDNEHIISMKVAGASDEQF